MTMFDSVSVKQPLEGCIFVKMINVGMRLLIFGVVFVFHVYGSKVNGADYSIAKSSRAEEACEGIQCPTNFKCKLVNNNVKCVGRVCSSKCPANFVLVSCHSSCQATCDNPNPICTMNLVCHKKPVCRCKPGYVIKSADDLSCIPKTDCPYSSYEVSNHTKKATTTPVPPTTTEPEMKFIVVHSNETIHHTNPTKKPATTTPDYYSVETHGGPIKVHGRKRTTPAPTLPTTTEPQFIVIHSNKTTHRTSPTKKPKPASTTPDYYSVESEGGPQKIKARKRTTPAPATTTEPQFFVVHSRTESRSNPQPKPATTPTQPPTDSYYSVEEGARRRIVKAKAVQPVQPVTTTEPGFIVIQSRQERDNIQN